MITIYKDKKDIPKDVEYMELNDVFFNQNTVLKLDDKANAIVEQIDEAELDGKYKMKSKFVAFYWMLIVYLQDVKQY